MTRPYQLKYKPISHRAMANSKNLLIALAVLSVILMLTLSSCSKKAAGPAAPKTDETAKAAEPAAAASEPAKPTETPAAPAEPATPAEPAAAEPAKTEAAAEPTKEEPKTSSEGGRFKLSYEPAAGEYNKELETFFKDTAYLDNFTSGVSDLVKLPQDVPVTVKECGSVDAKYDKTSKKITLCYELAGHFSDIISSNESGVPDEEIGQAVMDAMVHSLLHELSLATIDLNKLPTGGNEEAAADKVSTLLLLRAGPEGRDLSIMTSSVFYINGMLDNSAKIPYWSSHKPDGQRFLNMICWTYGNDPEGNKDMLEAGYLPAEEADSCVAELDKIVASPGKELEKYLK